MNKQEALVNLSAILNRGMNTREAADYFMDKKHPDLVETFTQVIATHAHLMGSPSVQVLQGMNDRGVDILLAFPNKCKVGIQIKSHYDITEADFAMKVKAAITNSLAYGLDKYFILLCMPYKDGKKNYAQKISNIVAELGALQTSSIVIYEPAECVNVFTSQTMSENEFRKIKNQFFIEPTDWENLGPLLRSETIGARTYLQNSAMSPARKAINGKAFGEFVGHSGPKELSENLAHLNHLFEQLQKLPRMTREIVFTVADKAKKERYTGGTFRIYALPQEILHTLTIGSQKLKKEVEILQEHEIGDYYQDSDDKTYIEVRNLNKHYNILQEIIKFSKDKELSAQSILIDLDFHSLDETN